MQQSSNQILITLCNFAVNKQEPPALGILAFELRAEGDQIAIAILLFVTHLYCISLRQL